LVCSTSLMMLGEQNIDSMFPKDVMVRGVVNENCSLSDADNAVDEVLKAVGITAQDRSSVSFYMDVCDVEDDGLSVPPNDSVDFTKLRSIYIVTAEQYELYTGKQASLAPGEIYRYSSADDVKDGDKIKIFGNEYSVKKSIDESGLEEFFDSSMRLFGKEVMVVADNNEKAAMLADCNSEEIGEDLFYIGFNAKDDISNEQFQTLRDTLRGKLGTVKCSYKEEERSSFYSLYGGTFFVGIFLAALFLIATVMIIFYKQMSEGMEDKKRFEILSNAGLSDKEARGVIKSQVMLMFFLPVCTAIIHIIFASNILRLFMAAILIVDTFTFNMAVAIVSLVFLGVYALVYRITSKQYYNIVYGEKKNNESIKENRESFVGNNSYNQCGAGNRA
ncbi:MAG: FtsX-like permease family protein, partial [Butyrivibrio sp.]|nr:FtsX-like permease family protein [Butyrivibrio sp.]